MPVNPAFSSFGVTELGIASWASRMLAANKKGAIMESTDEDNAAILLETELVRTFCVLLDIPPLGFVDFLLVEELIIPSDSNLGLVFLILCEEESSGISREIRALVVPILEAP